MVTDIIAEGVAAGVVIYNHYWLQPMSNTIGGGSVCARSIHRRAPLKVIIWFGNVGRCSNLISLYPQFTTTVSLSGLHSNSTGEFVFVICTNEDPVCYRGDQIVLPQFVFINKREKLGILNAYRYNLSRQLRKAPISFAQPLASLSGQTIDINTVYGNDRCLELGHYYQPKLSVQQGRVVVIEDKAELRCENSLWWPWRTTEDYWKVIHADPLDQWHPGTVAEYFAGGSFPSYAAPWSYSEGMERKIEEIISKGDEEPVDTAELIFPHKADA